jgi:hypothetical protein
VSQSAEKDETQSWHKHIAISCNNRAWDLSTETRTTAQDREMLDVAHTSAWHWARVGTELNRMRATMLLAEVHALLGMGPSAMTLAEEMRSYFTSRETPDWELAFVHAIYAHAAHAAGRLEEHCEAYGKAVVALEAITNEEERKVFLKTFRLVPEP